MEANDRVETPQQSEAALAPRDVVAVANVAPVKRKRRGVQFGPPRDEVTHVEQVTVRIRAS